MRSNLLLIFAFALPAAWTGQNHNPHQDVIVWPNGMPPAGMTHKEDFGNHILSISHREKDGRAELHQTKADVMIVQSGEATLVYSGQVIDPQPTAPNEIQGSGIKGGTRITVKAGDVIHIPTGVPHQFFLAPGKQITYMLVKVVDTPNQNR
jgi:mannose-6-phosphate isomerase-like protein (cupin superfamily)